jgi:DNA-binding transcriptional MocR family regulator
MPSTGRLCARVRPSAPDPHHPRPWRRGSVFGDGPRRPLSADERRIWLARADLERKARRLTALHVDVAEALLKRLGVEGQCDPAHATLAEDVGCDPSTVLRALTALRAVGLVTWERRLVRRPWPLGGWGATRAEQTSNAYELLLPDRPVAPREDRRCSAVRLKPDCDRQPAGETPSQLILRSFPEVTEAELQRLKAIQAVRWAQLNAQWHAKRAARWCGKG